MNRSRVNTAEASMEEVKGRLGDCIRSRDMDITTIIIGSIRGVEAEGLIQTRTK
jgi:ABC-type thiamin/hydroxymethylpyrimidine transport system permease subunit